MRKIIIVGVIIVLVVIAIAVAPLSIWQPIDYQKRISFGEAVYYIVSSLMMFATVATVIIALLQKPLRDRWNKPKIKVGVGKQNPFIEEIVKGENSDSIEKEIIIRIKLENTGNYTATHSVLNSDSFYKKTEDARYVKTEYTHKSFRDCNGHLPNVIAPHLNYYFDLAIIKKLDNPKKADEKGHQLQNYKLFLITNEGSINLGKGEFVVPVKFYSSRTESVVSYIKLFWNSDNYSTSREYLNVEIIKDTEFNNLNFG